MYFKALTADRLENAKILDKPSMAGVKDEVVDKYSDQAHFVYELLQNADDAGATRADFELYGDKLIFRHNGSRHFTVSDPKTEKADKISGKLGDINAITSIGNTNKTTAATIGKFGVGFKAVFQYTDAPEIYDKYYRFKIEKFIVPMPLQEDYHDRKADETLFLFPFNNPNAYDDIAGKLENLSYPILFLSNLEEVNFNQGFYKKELIYSKQYEDITEEYFRLLKNETQEETLMLFSREYDGLRYSVGFFIDRGKLISVKMPAFCFFPTKKFTGLNFIVHAPFLLTSSREGIKAGDSHNETLVNLLADLAADSLILLRENKLIDDCIVDIIPTNLNIFISSPDQISFRPFYDKIKTALKTQKLIPADGEFVKSENAYWAEQIQLTKLFSNEQLQEIVKNPDAAWAFTSRDRKDETSTLKSYIDDITRSYLNDSAIIKGITENFIERQPTDWLHKFYKWLSENSDRTNMAKTLPLFLDSNGKAAAAFLPGWKANLFLPSDDVSDYPTVHRKLLANPDTKKFLIEKIGIKTPSLKDEIYNKIFPKYKSFNAQITEDSIYFKKIFSYYMQLYRYEYAEYFSELKKILWLRCTSTDFNYSRPDSLYIPSEELEEYFTAAGAGKFVDFDFYLKLIGENKKDYLSEFFKELGLASEVRYFRYDIDRSTAFKLRKKWHRSTGRQIWYEKRLEGCTRILEKILRDKKISDSVILWKRLVAVNKNESLQENLYGRYEYFYRTEKYISFESQNAVDLRKKAWIVDKAGNFKSAEKIYLQDISADYDTTSDSAREVIKFLGIKEKPQNYLSAEEIELIDYGKIVKDAIAKGLSIGEIKNLLSQKQSAEKKSHDTKKKRSPAEIQDEISEVIQEENQDRDELTPPPVDYKKKLERLKQRAELEQEQLAQIEELRQKVLNAEKYSFAWFKACLELECLAGRENNLNGKEISISFGRVEREPDTSRTLILKYPNRFIPQFIEDLENIPLILDGSTKVEIEVVSVKHNTLRVKLKTGAEIENINLEKVREATINAQNPVFLLEELRKQFLKLNYADDFNLRDNLCENIEFIFGPPGTGKTTYLAEKIIFPIMQKPENKKILVLTPTNKAADVLTRKIMNSAENFDWLIRFGTTDDEIIEKNVFREKTFDIRSKPRNVTVTTIARFPYDYFLIEGQQWHLYNLRWDYIIIDEASMIPPANIIFPLYKKQPEKFYIAGDPHQIEPVIALDLWKNENIYTMVELNSFTDYKTRPHNYHVEKLTTQYRSVPSVGEIFSKLTYGGILKHHRAENDRRDLNLDDWLDIKTLNIIKFPVSKYESVYRAKRINNSSSYQAYSALLIFEFVNEMSKKISDKNPAKNFTIGIIAPYRVQADLIEKLFTTVNSPLNVQISTGTIHGFQGDECDIIIAVFNPPPYISNSEEMFLNRQNIINVAVSRARDYLFVVMPDDNTENICNLKLIKKIENLFKDKNFSEFNSEYIEELIFKKRNYIEENSFSTGHQNVNIYTEPERIYEIRSDDNAVDIQVNKN